MSNARSTVQQAVSLSRLFYVMGASGSGKDTLLRLTRPRLDQLPCLVAHRYITRPPELKGENHIFLSQSEFLRRKALGAFTMSWEANGYWYGVGQEIDHWLSSGSHVLMNGSRAYANEAARQYGERLVPVVIDVSAGKLETRLTERGRESAEEIDRRVARAGAMRADIPANAVWINNDDDTESAVLQLLDLISSYSRTNPGTS